MQKVIRVLNNLKKFSIFYFSFVYLADDREMKTKNLNETWIRMVSFLIRIY